MVFALSIACFFGIFFSVTTFICYHELREFKSRYSSLLLEKHNLKIEHDKLASEQKPAKVLSVEAEQLLNDMTRHGHSIVRIIPISPADVFWRSPS